MKVKYIVLYVTKEGITREYRFPVEKRVEAMEAAQAIVRSGDFRRIRCFSIDSEFDDLWYDLTEKWTGIRKEKRA